MHDTHIARRYPAARRRRSTRALAGLIACGAAVVLAACSSTTDPQEPAVTAPPATSVSIVTHDSFAISDEAKAAFEEQSGLTLEVVKGGDAGELVNKLILTKGAPLADVFFGADGSSVGSLLASGAVDPYASAAVPADAARFAADEAGSVAPIDYGPVCLNIDGAWFDEHDVPAPASYEDLLKPEYKDLIVLLDPTASSPGTTFLLGTIAHFGADGYLDYWRGLVDNGAKIDNGWSDAYYSDFSGGGEDGTRPVVISYSTSPAWTLNEAGDASVTAALLSTCTDQVEYAGVLAGAKNPEGARALVDFLLGTEFQSGIPDGMYMYPVLSSVPAPADWETFAPLPTTTNDVPAAEISQHRDAWLAAWADAVGQ